MCGRFARKSTQEVLADWFGVELEDMPWFAPTYNAAPQSVQPVVRLNRDSGQREVALLRWGLVPYWAKDAKLAYSTINARAEEVAAKPVSARPSRNGAAWCPPTPFTSGRGLTRKTKRPLAIALRSGEPYAFAGLWEHWQPREGSPLETFTIITTDANEVTEPLHDRMPVILERRDYDRWLDAGDPARPPIDLLRPTPPRRCLPGRSATASETFATTIPNCLSTREQSNSAANTANFLDNELVSGFPDS